MREIARRHSYDHSVTTFVIERTTPLSMDEAWRRITAWHRHAESVPLTRITVVTPPPTREGTVFVARSGFGPLAFDDPMEVTVWRPPEDGRPGMCRLTKRGRVVTGWAEIEVQPERRGHSRVVWREDLHVRPLPSFASPIISVAARWVFARAVNDLLRFP